MKIRLAISLGAYLVLALIATFTLDGVIRTVLWLFFAGLVVKTLMHSDDEDMD